MCYEQTISIFLVTIITVCVVGLFFGEELILDDFQKGNAADIAWIITATCLVFLMTPGLSFFYGGMVSQKHFINDAPKLYGIRFN